MAQSDVPEVSLVRCAAHDSLDDVKPAVERACELVGGLESLVMPGDTVLIKPNLVQPYPYTTGATTNPYVVEALVELCRAAHARRIVVADGSCVGASTEEAFEKCGYADLARRQNCELVDFTRCDFTYVMNPLARKMKRIRIPDGFIRANVVIDVPVMKTHDALEVSLGLKNMKGLLQTSDKKRFHKWGLAQSIVDLNQIARPDFTVLDGTVAMEGSGPTSGDPVDLGLVGASKDVVAADTVACEIMGFTLDEVPYIRMAGDAGIGCAELAAIDVLGECIEDVRRPFSRNSIDPALLERYGIELEARDACSGCANAIASFLASLNRRGRLGDMHDTILLYGQSVEKLPAERTRGKRVIRVGTCTRRLVGYERFLPGCPPYPYHMLKDLGLDGE